MYLVVHLGSTSTTIIILVFPIFVTSAYNITKNTLRSPINEQRGSYKG